MLFKSVLSTESSHHQHYLVSRSEFLNPRAVSYQVEPCYAPYRVGREFLPLFGSA